MNDKEFQDLATKVEQGKKLPMVDKFLYEQERQIRALPLNPLQQQIEDRQKNPLLEPRKWRKAW